MPPEAKKVISSLAEMTCENCVYFQKIRLLNACINPDSGNWDQDKEEYCSKGKWFTSELHYDEAIHGPNPHLADFDTCYYLFGRAK